jgi:voltage-gated potassium channel
MAAFALQPHVAEFLDVVMHEDGLKYRIEEFPVAEGSSLLGTTVVEADLRATTGALLLALRQTSGRFLANPSADTVIDTDAVLIVLGTPEQLDGVRHRAGGLS